MNRDTTILRLDRLIDVRGARLILPEDAAIFEACQMAAALPSDDYPLFTFATAFLLADRLQGGDGPDSLYWNWESFREEYELADPSVRTAILNAFRFGSMAGVVSIPEKPNLTLCQTRERDMVLDGLSASGLEKYEALVSDTVPSKEAGAAWTEIDVDRVGPSVIAVFRYLYERPESMSPPSPEIAPLIPWSPV